MIRVSLFVVISSLTSTVHAGVQVNPDRSTPDAATLIYEPSTVSLRVDDGGRCITTIEIDSAAGYFTGAMPPQVPINLFNIYSPMKLFLLDPSCMTTNEMDFGPTLSKNLSTEVLAADLTVNGSTTMSVLSPVYLYNPVPEPSFRA